MDKDKVYYENWLNYIRNAQLNAVGNLLTVEMSLYEARKLIQQALELNEYSNPALDRVKSLLSQLKSKQRRLAEEIDSHDLDIAHCEFMIELLSRPTNEDG